MRFPRRLPRRAFRHVVAVAALLAQVIAATGAPVFARPGARKAGAISFPCQNHPCGCATSEQGWAGDCCCFTLEEKLAWADARGVTPPEHVRPAVAARKLARTSETSCCSKKSAPSCCDRTKEEAKESRAPEHVPPAKPGIKWVAGVFAQKCRGEGTAGLLKLELISIVSPSAAVREVAHARDSVRVPDPLLTSTLHLPPTPPPRNS